MNRGVKPSRRVTSSTARPVTTPSGRMRARRQSRSATAAVTRASSARATMGASVPSKSNTSRGRERSAIPIANLPSASNRCFSSGIMVALNPGFYALPQARSTGIRQHEPRPAIDIELAHRHAQTGHPLAVWAIRHGQGLLHRVGAFLDVIGIDDQRLGHLAGCSGKTAQYQHAMLVVACSYKFLADQAHAVVQTGYQTKVGGAIQFGDGVVVVMCYQQVQWSIVRPTEALVDPLAEFFQALLERPIFRQRGARRRGDLHQHELTDPLRMLFQ